MSSKTNARTSGQNGLGVLVDSSLETTKESMPSETALNNVNSKTSFLSCVGCSPQASPRRPYLFELSDLRFHVRTCLEAALIAVVDHGRQSGIHTRLFMTFTRKCIIFYCCFT